MQMRVEVNQTSNAGRPVRSSERLCSWVKCRSFRLEIQDSVGRLYVHSMVCSFMCSLEFCCVRCASLDRMHDWRGHSSNATKFMIFDGMRTALLFYSKNVQWGPWGMVPTWSPHGPHCGPHMVPTARFSIKLKNTTSKKEM